MMRSRRLRPDGREDYAGRFEDEGPGDMFMAYEMEMLLNLEIQTMMINQIMCSSVCPCSPKVASNMSDKRVDVKSIFQKMPESTLNSYGRTAQNNTDFIPLVFNGTFSTFNDCIMYYIGRVLRGVISEEQMLSLFEVDPFLVDGEYYYEGEEEEEGGGGDGGDEEYEEDDGYDEADGGYEFNFFDFDILSDFEKNFGCQGICMPTLFYYGESTANGMPSESCQEPLEQKIKSLVIPVKVTAILMAISSVISFLLHFSLYFNPTSSVGIQV